MKRFISILTCVLLLFSLFLIPAAATKYANNFPSAETGLTGGAYLVCMSSIGSITVLLPYNYKDNYLTFTTAGNLFNCSSNTISCSVYRNGTRYDARFSAWGGLSYRVSSSGYYDYTDITVTSVVDTNCKFVTDSDKQNESYYFSDYQRIVVILLCAILIFVYLGWFLWHKT